MRQHAPKIKNRKKFTDTNQIDMHEQTGIKISQKTKKKKLKTKHTLAD